MAARFDDLFPAGASVSERLLAGVALRIELLPSQHRLAVERYEAVRTWIERPGSPLKDLVARFYPQGSMAIGGTIRAKGRDKGYDIDIVAELLLPVDARPSTVLDLLYQAIRGEPGSRYYNAVERQTRCVTVHYADGMHLDVTPSILVDQTDPRKSHIFHAKPEEAPTQHYRLIMNSAAFADEFRSRTPIDLSFAEMYERMRRRADTAVRADADVDDVPDHSAVAGGKSATVVALQLLKRNRNLGYAVSDRHNMRMPPSAMLSCLAMQAATPGSSIGQALDTITAHVRATLKRAHDGRQLVDVRNPRCNEDRFTDRWPDSLMAQQLYLNDLRDFQTQLAELLDPATPLRTKGDLLKEMFGEDPARDVIDDVASLYGASVRTGTRRISPSGQVVLPAGVAAISSARPAPAHTFFGPGKQRR